MEPLLEAEAPRVRGGVGDALTVLLPLNVELGVAAAVALLEGVGLAVGVPVGEALLVALALKELEPVALWEAPRVSDGVGEALMVLLPLDVVEGVEAAV